MIERSRALALRWFEEVWNRRLGATADELFAPAAVGHMEGVEVVGPAALHKVRAALLAAFPDLGITVEDTVAEGNKWSCGGGQPGLTSGRVRCPSNPCSDHGPGDDMASNRKWTHRRAWDAWNQGAPIEGLRAASRE